MGAVVPEEDSSSLNDKFIIADIFFLKQNKCRIKFIEGKNIILESTLITSGALYKGQQLALEEIKNLKKRSKLLEAERVSMNLISKCLHPKHLLKLKLLKRGFKKETINRIIKKLIRVGYLNDYEYAKAWLLSRIEKKPESNIKLYAELKKRGINDETAKKAISKVITEEIQEKCIKEIIWKKAKTDIFDKDYFFKLLLTKGFPSALIKKILSEF